MLKSVGIDHGLQGISQGTTQGTRVIARGSNGLTPQELAFLGILSLTKPLHSKSNRGHYAHYEIHAEDLRLIIRTCQNFAFVQRRVAAPWIAPCIATEDRAIPAIRKRLGIW